MTIVETLITPGSSFGGHAKFAVQFVQDDIGQQRTQRTALWRAFMDLNDGAVGQDHLGLEQAVNQLKDTAVRRPLSQPVQQTLMVNTVEELRQVEVDERGVAFFDERFGLGHSGMSTPFWTEAMAAGMKVRFKQRCQYLSNRLLNPTVYHIGNTQSPLTASGLGDTNPTDVAGTIDFCQQRMAEFASSSDAASGPRRA